MGIEGLAGYVSKDPGAKKAWESDFKLKDTRLVVDGNNFLRSLVFSSGIKTGEPDLRHGGQYADLHRRTVNFFTDLRLNGVAAIVVFDGVHDYNFKLSTIRKHQNKRLKSVARMASSCSQYDHGVGRATVLPVW